MSYRLGVDVGGTFTDLLLINEETGATFRVKVPTTRANRPRPFWTESSASARARGSSRPHSPS